MIWETSDGSWWYSFKQEMGGPFPTMGDAERALEREKRNYDGIWGRCEQ